MQDFRSSCPTNAGFGSSDKPTEVDAYAIPFLALDVTAILDALSIDRAHVVGHDWGAAVAWATASFAPDRVDRLVAMSVGHPSSFGGAGMTQREKSWYMLLFQFAGVAEQWLSADEWAGSANGRSIQTSTLSSATSNAMVHSPPD